MYIGLYLVYPHQKSFFFSFGAVLFRLLSFPSRKLRFGGGRKRRKGHLVLPVSFQFLSRNSKTAFTNLPQDENLGRSDLSRCLQYILLGKRFLRTNLPDVVRKRLLPSFPQGFPQGFPQEVHTEIKM